MSLKLLITPRSDWRSTSGLMQMTPQPFVTATTSLATSAMSALPIVMGRCMPIRSGCRPVAAVCRLPVGLRPCFGLAFVVLSKSIQLVRPWLARATKPPWRRLAGMPQVSPAELVSPTHCVKGFTTALSLLRLVSAVEPEDAPFSSRTITGPRRPSREGPRPRARRSPAAPAQTRLAVGGQNRPYGPPHRKSPVIFHPVEVGR
jgi:hypothetical protein